MSLSDMKFSEKIDRFHELLDQADSVLIGAGSGLSADAGIDYTDPQAFSEKYPLMLQYGYTTNIEMMTFDLWSDPGLFWGYYISHGNNMRFGPSEQSVYRKLFDLVRSKKDHFVITTNVDAFFTRNGFSDQKIYTPQGDYGRIQCRLPCSDQTWLSEPVIKGLLPSLDPTTGRLPENLIPVCPNCGGPVFYNIRGADWFVDAPYEKQRLAFADWIKQNRNKRLVLIEVGAGFNTPVWIRWPFEKITRDNPDASLIRINPEDHDVPAQIAHRSIIFPNRASEVIDVVTGYEQKLKKAN